MQGALCNSKVSERENARSLGRGRAFYLHQTSGDQHGSIRKGFAER